MSDTNTSFPVERLDSELLRTFMAIAETGSFTRGAERIFRTQSAASLQMKRLESVVGGPVFERHGRGVALTPAGERLLPVARRVVGVLDSTLAELRADSLQGTIRIGIPEEYAETILTNVIARFARHHPRVELVVRSTFSAGFRDALMNDEMDIAVYDVETVLPGVQLLRQERTFWAASRHHQIQDANPLPVALFDHACWWRDRTLDALHASGRDFRIAFTSESVAGVIAAIRSGVAVGVLGEDSWQDDLVEIDAGLPGMPMSNLVLDARKTVDPVIASAIFTAIRDAYAPLARAG